MTVEPAREWWTAAELASAGLPDLPGSRQGVETLAKRNNWRTFPSAARRRTGRGGGWEYHWTILPMRAQKRLLSEAADATETGAVVPEGRNELWTWFDAQPDEVKAKATRRLQAMQMALAFERGGLGRHQAISEAADMAGCSVRTAWNWAAAIEGVRPDDWLPVLAPRHRMVKRGGPKTECSPEFWDFLKSDYLRPERPAFSACYRRAVRVAKDNGWTPLPERTARRRLEDEVSKATRTLARRGADALKAMYPPQRRDRTALHALEAVNADFHRFDVFVEWPVAPGSAETEIVRPQMVAFQDVFSGRILSWRVDRTPNKEAVRLAFGDLVEEFGIPEHLLLDNGREFANKALTGQARTRYRFQIKDDDPTGLFVALGIELHWATPYSGQSKPIERAFRDLCEDVSKDPRFAGAYTGNRPDAKPENYRSKAIPLATFLRVLTEGLHEHNARTGRRSHTAQGRSFIETFDASYGAAPIRKATEVQRRLWLTGAEGIRAHEKSGAIAFMDNIYYADWLIEVAGDKVVIRFDPADLFAGVHVYSLANEYLGHAPIRDKAGFFDVDEARAHAKARRDFMKAERAAREAHTKLKVTELGAYLDRAAKPAPTAPEARVVKPVFADQAAKAPKRPRPAPAVSEERHEALIASFAAAQAKRPAKPEDDGPLARFARAIEIEKRLRDGEAVGADDQRWLGVYQQQPEYLGQRKLYDQFGEAMFG